MGFAARFRWLFRILSLAIQSLMNAQFPVQRLLNCGDHIAVNKRFPDKSRPGDLSGHRNPVLGGMLGEIDNRDVRVRTDLTGSLDDIDCSPEGKIHENEIGRGFFSRYAFASFPDATWPRTLYPDFSGSSSKVVGNEALVLNYEQGWFFIPVYP